MDVSPDVRSDFTKLIRNVVSSLSLMRTGAGRGCGGGDSSIRLQTTHFVSFRRRALLVCVCLCGPIFYFGRHAPPAVVVSSDRVRVALRLMKHIRPLDFVAIFRSFFGRLCLYRVCVCVRRRPGRGFVFFFFSPGFFFLCVCVCVLGGLGRRERRKSDRRYDGSHLPARNSKVREYDKTDAS